MHPIRVFNGVLNLYFAKEAETRDQTRVLFSCEIVKEAQCFEGKERLFSFVPNALLVSLSSVFISFEIPTKSFDPNSPIRAGMTVCTICNLRIRDHAAQCQYYNTISSYIFLCAIAMQCSACSSQKLDAMRTNPKRWSNHLRQQQLALHLTWFFTTLASSQTTR